HLYRPYPEMSQHHRSDYLPMEHVTLTCGRGGIGGHNTFMRGPAVQTPMKMTCQTSPRTSSSLGGGASSGGGGGSEQSTKVGAIIRIRLSNYSNPHQVLSETGMPCEQNRGLCDPVFHVKLGTQGYSFEQSRNSNVFDNVVSLNGEFFTTEFRLLQELPDLLLIRVKIEDNDAFDPVPQTIGEITEEFHRLLPSIPTRWNNSVTKELFFTPINKYVSLTLTIDVQCLPGLYGRRCSTQCTGSRFIQAARGATHAVRKIARGQQQQQQQQQQQLLSNLASAQQAQLLPPTERQTARYKNPVYHQQQQAGHTEEEVYEEVEEPRDGKEAPPLPPKDATSLVTASSAKR
uniref:C2 domain-containing protein n=1 Tax=Macrostomum lignano TaxID=282301 RepID=A0A1I8HAA8_9PLAT